MNKKLAFIAVCISVLLVLGGLNSSFLYGTEYMQSKSGYSYSVSSGADWWDCNWSYCKKITIDHTKVESDQTNYPVLIRRDSDSDLAAHAQSDGDDIAFVDQYNTTQYSHEIEEYGSATGELTAWVKVTSLSSTADTILYMYYGNPTCINQQNVTNTWDSNFKMVQHLNESSGTLLDSTSNNNDGTNTGATYNTSSKIDGGYDFDGNDDINTGNDSSLNITSSITLEGWVKDPPLIPFIKNIETNVRIIDKQEEQRNINPGDKFTVERTISTNKNSKITFAVMYSPGMTLNDITVNKESVFAGVYTLDKTKNDYEKTIEQYRTRLPQKIKELPQIAYTKPISINGKATIKMQFTAEKWLDIFPDERISYLAFSSTGGYDFESTTHLNSIASLIDPSKIFSFFESIGKIFEGDKKAEKISYKNLPTEEAEELIESDENIIILDVRTWEEYSYGHINGAISAPLLELENRTYMNSLAKSYKKNTTLVYSRSGFQSEQACNLLKHVIFL